MHLSINVNHDFFVDHLLWWTTIFSLWILMKLLSVRLYVSILVSIHDDAGAIPWAAYLIPMCLAVLGESRAFLVDRCQAWIRLVMSQIDQVIVRLRIFITCLYDNVFSIGLETWWIQGVAVLVMVGAYQATVGWVLRRFQWTQDLFIVTFLARVVYRYLSWFIPVAQQTTITDLAESCLLYRLIVHLDDIVLICRQNGLRSGIV